MKTLIVTFVLLCATAAVAQTTQPVIKLSVGIEDGKKMVHALVSLNDKPKENVTLQYFVQRTFGNLPIGEDATLDDGTSAVPFPSNLPGAADGNLHLIARVKTPADFTTVSAAATFPADTMAPAAPDAFPRALWAPNAPVPLMLSIGVLLAGIWCSYLFVVTRIFAIRRGA